MQLAGSEQGGTSANAGIPEGLRVDGLYFQPVLRDNAPAATSLTIGEHGLQRDAGTSRQRDAGEPAGGGGEGRLLRGKEEEQEEHRQDLEGRVPLLSAVSGGGGDRVYFVVGGGSEAAA